MDVGYVIDWERFALLLMGVHVNMMLLKIIQSTSILAWIRVIYQLILVIEIEHLATIKAKKYQIIIWQDHLLKESIKIEIELLP